MRPDGNGEGMDTFPGQRAPGPEAHERHRQSS